MNKIAMGQLPEIPEDISTSLKEFILACLKLFLLFSLILEEKKKKKFFVFFLLLYFFFRKEP